MPRTRSELMGWSGRAFRGGAAGVCLWMAAGMAGAGGQPQASPAKRVGMPDEVWFAARVDDGAAWRTHEPTRRVMGVLTSSVPAEATKAWSELAGSLGMKDGEGGEIGFDALLGRRVVLCLAKEGGWESGWGSMGVVTAEAAAKLEAKLEPVPRGFENGRAVMLVERGKFRLTRVKDEEGAAAGLGGGAGEKRVVLTPGEGAELVEMTIRSAAALDLVGKETGSAVWFCRGEAGVASGSVVREDRGWGLTLRADAEMMGLTRAACREAAKGEGAGVVGAVARASGDKVLLEVVGRMPAEFPGAARAGSVMGVLAASKVPMPEAGVVGERILLRVERVGAGAAAAGGEKAGAGKAETPLVVVVGCEVKDRRAAADAFDSMMVGMLDLAWKLDPEATASGKGRDFRKEIERAKGDPGAVRVVVLGGAKGGGAAVGGGGAGGGAGTLAWTTVAGQDGGSAWWLARFVPGESGGGVDEAERGLQEIGAVMAGCRAGPVLGRVSVRPAELWEAAGLEAVASAAPWLRVLKELESVEMTVSAAGDGVAGTGRVVAVPGAEKK